MTQDEPDTCRICSAPAEPDAPLFHPCRCSGTIRYIHQDCLTTWLAHSKKKSCDVCKYQYTFTKVYSENMPRQIPFILFLRKFAQKTFWALVMGIRGLMVATIWLAFLPYVTVWTWRFYFIMGENVAWWIYDHPRPDSTPIFHSYFTNLTLADDQNRTNTEKSILGLVTSYPIWRALSADIFTGQIIASLIVLVFLGIFLLREWIIQNARPGVFGEEEGIDAEVQDGIEGGAEPGLIEEAVPLPPLIQEPVEDQRGAEVEQGPGDDHNPPSLFSVGDVSAARDAVERDRSPPKRKRRLNTLEESDEDEEDERPVSRIRAWRNATSSSEGDESRWSVTVPGDSAQDTLPTGVFEEGRPRIKITSTFSRPSSSSAPASSSQSFSFGPPPDRSDLFQYQPSSSLPFPLTAREAASNEAESTSARYPLQPTVDLSISDSQDLKADSAAPSLFIASSSTEIAGSSKEPLPLPSFATYRAPEQLDVDALSSAGSETEYNSSSSSLNSERESNSSTVATMAESAFLEDLDEYFPEEDATEEAQGPIRVEELLDNDDMLPDEADGPALAEDNEPGDAAEDQDAINDDDVDGALEEAIGMRGPLTSVFQNAALMIFVLDTTIGLAVWLPFTIGKTAALLSLEPARIVHLLQWPIRVIRYATDPMVDLFALTFLRGIQVILETTTNALFDFSAGSTDPNIATHSSLGDMNSLKPWLDIDVLRILINGGADGQTSGLMSGVDHVANSPVGQLLEPYFARLGRKVRLNATWLKAGWVELANGDANVNKFFAIALGYLIAGLLLSIYLNVLNVGNVQSAGRAIRNAIKQQLIVLKVAVFILIELVVFPLGCGIMLDFCTLQLFPDATVQSRLSFFAYAPVTATFYHWMVGTMFMYQFAILLGGCRKIMRPGALWFIKDPQDQNFHPIRDILDRPTFTQVRKLAISAVMYSFVVALGMGGLVACLHFWGRFLLPLRWKLREPLSEIPIDLLFLHIGMPSTIKYFRPRKLVFALATAYWKWAARQLRLTSYMFGDFHRKETRPSKDILSWLLSLTGYRKADRTRMKGTRSASDGSYRRVPAQDNISLPREIRATVAVDRDGTPLDDAGRRLMELQNFEAEKAKRLAADDYTVVYLPPRFRERVIIFIISLWLVGSSVLVASLAVPTLLGRAVFSVALGREVHDGYSFIAGFYLLWGCYHVGMLLDRWDKRRQRSSTRRSRAKYAVYVFKRSMLWIGNVFWVAIWFGIIIPTLLALVIEVYLVHPLRIVFNPELTLRIRIFDSWVIGLVYTKMILSTMRLRPETRIDTAIKEMKERGWRDLNAVAVTLDIIAPVAAGLLGMLLLPIIIVLGLQQLLPTKIREPYLSRLSCPSIAVLYVYPGIFTFAAGARMYTVLQSLFASWAQQIRDSEFLVEMRLRNLEHASQKPNLDAEGASTPVEEPQGD